MSHILGRSGAGTEGTCLNVDECAANTASCPENSQCLDSDGSYTCPCDYGFKANGGKCEQIDECGLGNNCDQVSQTHIVLILYVSFLNRDLSYLCDECLISKSLSGLQ